MSDLSGKDSGELNESHQVLTGVYDSPESYVEIRGNTASRYDNTV